MLNRNFRTVFGLFVLGAAISLAVPQAFSHLLIILLGLGTLYFFIVRTNARMDSKSHPRMKKLYVALSYALLIVALAGMLFPADLMAQDDNGPAVASESAAVMAKAGNFLTVETTLLDRFMSGFGIVFMVLVGYLWNKAFYKLPVKWRVVVWGVVLQAIIGVLVLKTPGASDFFFNVVDQGVNRLLSFSEAGANFVFQTVEPHWVVTGFDPTASPQLFIGRISPALKSFAFWILPTIVFFSSLMTVLYHLEVMQHIVKFFAKLMQMTMKTSGSESLSAAANIFVGQTEAPLVVKPFVATMTKSELHAVMVGGFATVAGGVMAAYVSFLKDIPGIAGHLVTASLMSAPAALAISKVMYPETEESDTAGDLKMHVERPDANVIEAAARGASDGMTLMLNVMAMLMAFVGLVALADWVLTVYGETMNTWNRFSVASIIILALGGYGLYYFRGSSKERIFVGVVVLIVIGVPTFFMIKNGLYLREMSLSRLMGIVFSPFAWTMGVPWANGEALTVGRLLGEKIVLTEFIAYISLGKIVSGETAMISQRSAIIASYALCGFANFASIGIQIGGIGGIAPSRRKDLAKLGLSAMVGGSLAAFMTGTIAGILL